MGKLSFILLLGITFSYGNASAQDNLPYTINIAGGYGNTGGQLFDFNFGEMVLVNTFTAGNTLLSQGFLQPYLTTVSTTVTDLTIVNNVITPNGDGKNDTWQIKNLDRYPDHKVSIFDRAGRLVFQTRNYQNDWQGLENGKPLNEDAYYYVIELGKGFTRLNGSITIVRDK